MFCVVLRAGITTGDTAWIPSFANLFLAMKGGEGVSLNGGRASVFLVKEEAHEITDVFYRGNPEVHLLFDAPTFEDCPF